MQHHKLGLLLLLSCLLPALSFLPSAAPARPSLLSAKKAKKPRPSGGFGAPASASAPPFDVSASLARSELLYDKLAASAFADVVSEDSEMPGQVCLEYVVTARGGTLPDWVPVAQLCLLLPSSGPLTSELLLPAAVKEHRRELLKAASVSLPSATLPANSVEYAVEPVADFMKLVYSAVYERDSDDASGRSSTADSLAALGLPPGASQPEVKSAYRKACARYHPDRFLDATEEERGAAEAKFQDANRAYDKLSSGGGGGGSGYRAISGGERVGFFEVKGKKDDVAGTVGGGGREGGEWASAVRCLEPEVSRFFLAKAMANAKEAAVLNA